MRRIGPWILFEQMVCFLLVWFGSLVGWNIYTYMMYLWYMYVHPHAHIFANLFSKHQSCANLSNLNSSCWIEILVEQIAFFEANKTAEVLQKKAVASFPGWVVFFFWWVFGPGCGCWCFTVFAASVVYTWNTTCCSCCTLCTCCAPCICCIH